MDNSDLLEFDFSANDNFLEGIPVGNSHLGLMVYGNPLREQLPLNENTFWINRNKKFRRNGDYYKNYKKVQQLLLENKICEANKIGSDLLINDSSKVYSSCGKLVIDYNTLPNISNYKRSLNLSEGYVDVEYDIDNNHIKRIYQSSFKNDAIAIHIESLNDISISVELTCEIKNKRKTLINNNCLSLEIKNYRLKYYSIVKLFAEEIRFVGNKAILTGNNINIYYMGATNKFKSNYKLYVLRNSNLLDISSDFKQYHINSIADYKSLYKRQSFHTNLDILDKYYNFSRYLLISSSRMNLAIPKCGLWDENVNNKEINGYDLNMSTPLDYSNCLEANLFECFIPLLNIIKKMNKSGFKESARLYHARGSVTHKYSDLNGYSGISGNGLSDSIWPLGQVKMCEFIFKYFNFTKDINFLKKYYNILLSNADFLKSILVLDESNKYVLAPTTSPNNSFLVDKTKCSLVSGCTSDDQIIYQFFYNLIVVNRILGHEENDNKGYLDIILNLHHTQISPKNLIMEYHDDYEIIDPSHKYVSHLYLDTINFLYPTNVVREASYNTILEKIKNNADSDGQTCIYYMELLIHLGKKEDAYKEFLKFANNYTSPTYLNMQNGFFDISANLGVARAIRDMFLVDSNNKLIIGLGLPKELNTYTLNGFPLNNNLVCDIFKTKYDFVLQIESDKEKEFVINYKKKDYFLNLKKGKNRFDLNIILDK